MTSVYPDVNLFVLPFPFWEWKSPATADFKGSRFKVVLLDLYMVGEGEKASFVLAYHFLD